MAAQYSMNLNFVIPEMEYQAEELRKRLLFSMANFAQVRFLSAVKKRMNDAKEK